MEFCFYFWDFVGPTKNSSRSTFWMVELVGKELVRHLEFGSIVLIMVSLEGMQSADF